MRALAAAGFGGEALDAAQPVGPLGQIALHCWGFCGGWAPERWPVYAALYPVPDWHHVIELMRTIRHELQATEQS